MFSRLCALALAILAASPFTAPFATCDLSMLLPHRAVVHHRTHDSGRISTIDVGRVHALPLKRVAGWVIPLPGRTIATPPAAPRFVGRSPVIQSRSASFQSPLRI